MKKILSTIALIILFTSVSNITAIAAKQNAIYTVEDGTKLECTAKRVRGSIDEL